MHFCVKTLLFALHVYLGFTRKNNVNKQWRREKQNDKYRVLLLPEVDKFISDIRYWKIGNVYYVIEFVILTKSFEEIDF